jgi:hypothetical protein
MGFDSVFIVLLFIFLVIVYSEYFDFLFDMVALLLSFSLPPLPRNYELLTTVFIGFSYFVVVSVDSLTVHKNGVETKVTVGKV